MKNLLKTIGILALGLFATFASAKDVFDFKMTLKVPRVYNNERSLGFRKYQKQIIKGKMVFEYNQDGSLTNVQFRNVYNVTHKLSTGNNVTYNANIDPDVMYPRFVAIGDNRKKKFNVPSVCFFLVAKPSYSIGWLNEDNSLYVMVSGNGLLHSKGYVKKLNGHVSGTIGCSCSAFGHLSPTRILWFWGASDQVDDVAAVFGTWYAKFNKKQSNR